MRPDLTLKEYRWSDMVVGLTHEFTATVERSMIQRFADDTGDVNPLHVDQEFAKGQGFPDQVVHGMLTAGFYSTLVGMFLPGKYALLQKVDASFTKPVFPGDQLTIRGEVTYLNDAYHQIEISASIQNQKGEKVSRAKIKAGLHE